MGGKGRLQARRVPPSLTPGRGPFICGAETDSRSEATTPTQTPRLVAKRREPARSDGPGPIPERPQPWSPPGRSLAYPGHPAPSVPAQEVRTRRGEPLTS